MKPRQSGRDRADSLDDEALEGWAEVDSSPEDIISESDTHSDNSFSSSGIKPENSTQVARMEPSVAHHQARPKQTEQAAEGGRPKPET
eukprot:scaffold163830_cov47-Prasinocladus_malaysianus.AAC.1